MPFWPDSIAEGRTLNCRLSLVAINVAEFRLLLSALHYNENADRKQAVNWDGELEYTVTYPKARLYTTLQDAK